MTAWILKPKVQLSCEGKHHSTANNGEKKPTHLRKWEKHIVPFENSSSLNYITQWNWSFWCFKSVGKRVELVRASRFLQTLVDWLHDSNESKTWFCNLSETREWLKHFIGVDITSVSFIFAFTSRMTKAAPNYMQWVTSSELLPGDGAGFIKGLWIK